MDVGDVPRTFVLPSGVWLEVSRDDWTYAKHTVMVVPQDVREINYHPLYRDAGVNAVRILPGSRLERIGEGTFDGTNIREFVAPPSLREVGIAAFINCQYLTSANLALTEKVGALCFWGTSV